MNFPNRSNVLNSFPWWAICGYGAQMPEKSAFVWILSETPTADIFFFSVKERHSIVNYRDHQLSSKTMPNDLAEYVTVNLNYMYVTAILDTV